MSLARLLHQTVADFVKTLSPMTNSLVSQPLTYTQQTGAFTHCSYSSLFFPDRWPPRFHCRQCDHPIMVLLVDRGARTPITVKAPYYHTILSSFFPSFRRLSPYVSTEISTHNRQHVIYIIFLQGLAVLHTVLAVLRISPLATDILSVPPLPVDRLGVSSPTFYSFRIPLYRSFLGVPQTPKLTTSTMLP